MLILNIFLTFGKRSYKKDNLMIKKINKGVNDKKNYFLNFLGRFI